MDFGEYADNIAEVRGSSKAQGVLVIRWDKMAGTSNISERKQNEDTVQFLENASPLKKIESKYQRIRVKDIQQGIDFSACILKGKRSTSTAHHQM